MSHLANHQREGCRMVESRPELEWNKYMDEKRLIPSLEDSELQIISSTEQSLQGIPVDTPPLATIHPSQKRQLSPRCKERINMEKRKGVCEKCEQRKKRVFDSFFQNHRTEMKKH